MGQTAACQAQCHEWSQPGAPVHVQVESRNSLPSAPADGLSLACFGRESAQCVNVQECCTAAGIGEDVHAIVEQQSCFQPEGRLHTPAEIVGNNSLSRSRLQTPHLQRKFADYYRLGKKLGEGSFGDVYEATSLPVHAETGEPRERSEGGPDVAAGSADDTLSKGQRRVAVKVFHLFKQDGNDGGSPQGPGEDVKKRASFEAELAMLASLEHPHIARMYESFQDNDTLYIVLENCRGGELYGRLVATVREQGGGGLGEPLARCLFRQMLLAVGYLHAKRIVHCDIKTENFLLVGPKGAPDGDLLKLCDFGTAMRLTHQRPRSTGNTGTLSYTAPEVYSGKGADVTADCWSLGVVLYILLTGTNPFRLPGKTCNREETVRRIKAADFETRRRSWQNVSSAGQDLVKRLLVLDEGWRFTCTQALAHHWTKAAEPPIPVSGIAGSPGQGVLAAYSPRITALLLCIPRLSVAQRLALVSCALAAQETDLEALVPWRELFLDLDANQDGRLSLSELTHGLKRLLGGAAMRLPDEQLAECATALDMDSSGHVDWIEWCALGLLGTAGLPEAHEPASTAFRLVDKPPLPALGNDSGIADGDQTIAQIISSGVPHHAANAARKQLATQQQSTLSFRDFRHVLSTFEVFEML